MAELMPEPRASEPHTSEPRTSDAGVDELPSIGSEQLRVLDALSVSAPRTSADVAARAGLSISTVQAVLGPLELEGVVVERERGWLKKAPKQSEAPDERG
jgi:DNA processing protein